MRNTGRKVYAVEDERILDLYFQRDESGIEETEKKYGSYLRTVTFRVLRDASDAEECVNDTWMRAWNAIPPARPKLFRAYLAKIARNLALNRLESENAGKRGSGETAACLDELEEFVASNASVEEEIDRLALTEAINGFLDEVPKDQREIFLQRYFYFYSVSEIAEINACTESRVKTLLFRLRNKLKERLTEEGFTI